VELFDGGITSGFGSPEPVLYEGVIDKNDEV
jgi:hypothetical protein